jgi:hypothetical protein
MGNAARQGNGNWLFFKGISAREHDPEKWEPVFGKDHAQSKS